MISLSHTRYGSGRRPGGERHGRSRRWRSDQASSAAGSGERASGGSERIDGMSGERTDDQTGRLAGAARKSERRPGFRAIGTAVARGASPIVARRGGGVLGRLKAEWAAVVGDELAAATWPASLGRDGALKLRVASSL